MTQTPHAATYGGFYEALAWTQGTNGPTKVNIPDELWDPATGENGDFFRFDLVDFFTIVADFDDQGIHYFEFLDETLDRWPDIHVTSLKIYCTEDDHGVPDDDALTSHGWLALHMMNKQEGKLT